MTQSTTSNPDDYDEDGVPWFEPGEAERNVEMTDLLVDRLPGIREAVQREVAQFRDGAAIGGHVIYGNTLPQYLTALATASPRDEAAVAEASAFLEEIASDEPYLSDIAELSVIESILDQSVAASRLFVGERGGPATRALAESCAQRWDLSLSGLLDPDAPRHLDGQPVRWDPRWQRREG